MKNPLILANVTVNKARYSDATSMIMGFVDKIEGNRLFIDPFTKCTCRETFCSIIGKKYFGSGSTIHYTDSEHISYRPTSFDVVIYNLSGPKNLMSGLKIAQKVINSLEKEVGWSLTQMKPLAPNIENGALNAVLYNAPINWMRSPHCVSLFLLIVKVCCLNSIINYFDTVDLNKIEFKDFYSVINATKFKIGLINQVYNTINIWIPLLIESKTIFGPKCYRKWFHRKMYKEGLISSEGISYFCFCTKNKVLEDKRNELLSKYDLYIRKAGGGSRIAFKPKVGDNS